MKFTIHRIPIVLMLLLVPILGKAAPPGTINSWFTHKPLFMWDQDTKKCSALDYGVPASLFGNRERVTQTERLSPDGRALIVRGVAEDKTVTEFSFYKTSEDCEKANKPQQVALSQQAKREAFVTRLRQQYSGRLSYESQAARASVQTFDLDCRMKDGRYLPLERVLLVRLSEMDMPKVYAVTRAERRGDETRIYDDFFRADGKYVSSSLVFTINKWDELHAHGFRMEAVLNSCFDVHGPIAVIPR